VPISLAYRAAVVASFIHCRCMAVDAARPMLLELRVVVVVVVVAWTSVTRIRGLRRIGILAESTSREHLLALR